MQNKYSKDNLPEEMWECLKHKSFITYETLLQHKSEMLEIQQKITEALSDYENFEGIDFIDVHAGGIQVRGHHKQIDGYTFGEQPTIKYDFSNKDEVIDDFIKSWKFCDTPEGVKEYQWFIEQGNKYGWD